MAITVNRVPQFSFLGKQGFRDEVLALPTVVWAIKVEVTGDLSAGNVVVQPDFRVNAFLKWAVSLEEAMGQHNDVTNNRTYALTIIPGEGFTSGDGVIGINAQSGQSAAGFRQGANFARGTNSFVKPSEGFLPAYIWRFNLGLPISLAVGNSNLEVYNFFMWGYLWDLALLKRGFLPVRP